MARSHSYNRTGMGESDGRNGRRAVTYCLVPRDLAARVYDALCRHFADDPSIEVVIERRGSDRREIQSRRARELPVGAERRKIRSVAGRRVGERRGSLVQVISPTADQLPRRARSAAPRLAFVELVKPSAQQLEDEEARRLVVAFQGGDQGAFEELYLRYFNHVYTYLRVLFRDDVHEAEDLTQQAFTNVFAALDRYELRKQPFRAWLFVIVRNLAFSQLDRRNRSEPVDPAELTSRHEGSTPEEPNLDAVDWISDRELFMLVARLPLSQRQVLVMRHMLDLSTKDIARLLERTPADVRTLEHRGRRFLEQRLTALGRAPTGRRARLQWRGRVRFLPVARARRHALVR